MDLLILSPARLVLAGLIVLGWTVIVWRARGRYARAPGDTLQADQLVLYASKGGLAARLAQELAMAHGLSALPLGQVTPQCLTRLRRAWFIVSTDGDGDAPENARAFARAVQTDGPDTDLRHLHYAMLALGDSGYPRFCGFGRQLDHWLTGCGARPTFPRIEVDRGAPADIARWQMATTATTAASANTATLRHRERISPPCDLDAVYRLVIDPPPAVTWSPGAILDLDLHMPDGTPAQRSYSVASLMQSGEIELLIRHRRDAQGHPGFACDWLTRGLPIGGRLALRLRAGGHDRALAHARRRDRPLLLIATGTGLAAVTGPLRAHLTQSRAPVWLIHAERHAPMIPHLALPQAGQLRVDTVLSRANPPRRLPDWLLQETDALRSFCTDGATILIGGGRAPGQAILNTLTQILPPGAADAILTDLY
ncbi:hypothetical protein BFP70_09145 [Thioclava sp. SK-1]|uniref:flavodoxin domain-containing protein n=1 Tax=Thioclava sp. SK-1 TaxID=1889770 RepID=UPI000825AB3C|nr:NADPH cytochrome P450 oxidoreductase family protein [Thioclava sp. SK-1]OCX65641.1 hypothetical protein BFP70_09145 [Thioclava sp. SK-1]